MSKEKNKGLVVWVIILSLLVVGLSGYLVYDKTLKDDTNNGNDVNKEENKDNNEVDNEQSNSLEMLNLDKLGSYKNYDGTYGDLENIIFSDIENEKKYYVYLSLDGKVRIADLTNGKGSKNIEINDVVDIISHTAEPSWLSGQYCYMLTKSGDVYYYKLDKVLNNDYSVAKVDNVSSVKRLINVRWGPIQNAGGSWALVAITENDEYINLGTASV